VKVQVEFNPAEIDQYRLIGYENRALREEDFADDQVDAGEIGAGYQVTAIYEVVPAGHPGWIAPRKYAAVGEAPLHAPGELATVRLRYKLPDGGSSRLIETPIPTRALEQPHAPQGDMAFAVAVAAFGQKLRGDTRLSDYDYAEVARLAGPQVNYWRQEFVELVRLAGRSDMGTALSK
jgi:Ca-activated chloride channel family protein